MKKNFSFLLLFICLILQAEGQKPLYSLFLIGDTGEDTAAGPALQNLKKELTRLDYSSGVVFLGDNVYPRGYCRKDEAKLCCQLQMLADYHGHVFFIPGNHDWRSQRKGGLKAVKAEEEFITQWLTAHRSYQNKLLPPFRPQAGYPGPATYSPGEGLLLVFIDTQWFLQYSEVGVNGSRKETHARFVHELDSILAAAKSKQQQVILLGHHPLYTNGVHSRAKQPFRFLVNYTPFQLLGLAGLNRLFSQDLEQPRYRKMRKALLEIIEKHGNVIYASGHEHNLQYFKAGSSSYIVSGAGSKTSRLRKHKKFKAEFSSDAVTGFFKIEFYPEGKRKVIVYRTGQEPLTLE